MASAIISHVKKKKIYFVIDIVCGSLLSVILQLYNKEQ